MDILEVHTADIGDSALVVHFAADGGVHVIAKECDLAVGHNAIGEALNSRGRHCAHLQARD